MEVLVLILLLLALVCIALAAFKVVTNPSRVELLALGLMFWMLTLVIGAFRTLNL